MYIKKYFDRNIILFFLWCALIALVLSYQFSQLPRGIKVGQKASKDIKAHQTYVVIDEKTTENYQQEAVESILPIFDQDEQLLIQHEKKIHEAFAELRTEAAFAPQNKNDVSVIVDEIINNKFGVKLGDEQLDFLQKNNFAEYLENALIRVLREFMAGYILPSPDMAMIGDSGVILRRIKLDEQEHVENILDEKNIRDKNFFHSVDEVKDRLLNGGDLKLDLGVSLNEHAAEVYALAAQFILPTVNYNAGETERERAMVVHNVPNVTIKVGAGEYIVRSGETYTDRHVVILEGIQKNLAQSSFTIKYLGTFAFVSLLLGILYLFAQKFIDKFSTHKNDLQFLACNLVLALLTVRIFAAASFVVRELLPVDVPTHILLYAIPLAGAAMLTRMLLNSETAMVFSLAASGLLGLFLGSDIGLPIYFLISCITGSACIAHADKRSSIIKAGLLTGIINAAAIVTIKIALVSSATEIIALSDLVNLALFGFLGGIFSAIFVLTVGPIAELLFDYTSDITLLEIGNSNHPLLRQMIVDAPGTYHHSQLVAILAEAAAREIGAHSLLCRVGAYFHDIGKMKKADYFIENQQGGINKHDKLAPSMSALIVCSHVKEGLELAREYKLPKRIAAFIPEHQGTKLITYFYNKAKTNEDKDLHTVDEKDYRYEGPRPQTRESGIILLADGVEAAVRAMSDKSPMKIKTIVQKMINKSFAEEQLDECELTLKDLHVIGQSFVEVLLGIYHKRIEYPDNPQEKPAKTNIIQLSR